MRKGFTLVELSIVLVIIGLLIGGILVGQSLIDSAKIKNFISSLNQFDIAITSFHSKYKQFPGDSPYHDAAGDGDGKIENSDANSGQNTSYGDFDYEVANFWRHLQQDNFLRAQYPDFSNDAAATGLITGTHFPNINMDDEGGVIIVYDDRYTDTNGGYDRYLYFCKIEKVIGNIDLANTNLRTGFLRPAQALAIDTKLDDGIASGTYNGTYKGRIYTWGGESANCVNGQKYDITSNESSCCLRIRTALDYGY